MRPVITYTYFEYQLVRIDAFIIVAGRVQFS